jgi:predicted metalloprotease
LAIYLCGGGDALNFFNQITGGGAAPTHAAATAAAAESARRKTTTSAFCASVLGSTEDVWNKVLPQQARTRYQDPKLVLFTDQVQSACGVAGSSTGPFYCPGDEKLYLDFGFFNELKTRIQSAGRFRASLRHRARSRASRPEYFRHDGQSSRRRKFQSAFVRLELQADCYAGVWAFYANQQGLVEAGDAEEAIRAASAVGDDAIQKRAQGYVVPESFTHGSSRERMQWFTRGYQGGRYAAVQHFRQIQVRLF